MLGMRNLTKGIYQTPKRHLVGHFTPHITGKVSSICLHSKDPGPTMTHTPHHINSALVVLLFFTFQVSGHTSVLSIFLSNGYIYDIPMFFVSFVLHLFIITITSGDSVGLTGCEILCTYSTFYKTTTYYLKTFFVQGCCTALNH